MALFTAAAALAPYIGTAVLGGAGIASWFGGKKKDEDDEDKGSPEQVPVKFHKAPEHEEAVGARQDWWSKLQEWGQDPNYGAISPDWGSIWQQASDRVKQHYWGGPGGQPGLAGKVKSSAAARGVSDSPALQTELSRMGMQEGSELRGLATDVGVKEAEFGEGGRQNWLQNMGKMANMQVAGTWSGGQTYNPYNYGKPQDTGMGDLASSIGGYLGSQGQGDWYSKLMQKYMQPTKTQSSINYGGDIDINDYT